MRTALKCKEDISQENIYRLLYLRCIDYNKRHLMLNLQSISPDVEKENIRIMRGIVSGYGLRTLLSTIGEYHYDYYPTVGFVPFANVILNDIAYAICEDIEFEENDGLYSGIARYRGKEYHMRDHEHSCTPSYKVGAAICIIELFYEELKKRTPVKLDFGNANFKGSMDSNFNVTYWMFFPSNIGTIYIGPGGGIFVKRPDEETCYIYGEPVTANEKKSIKSSIESFYKMSYDEFTKGLQYVDYVLTKNEDEREKNE